MKSKRIPTALKALKAYQSVKGEDTPESDIVDLITDLLHTARSVWLLNPESIVRTAMGHVEAEIKVMDDPVEKLEFARKISGSYFSKIRKEVLKLSQKEMGKVMGMSQQAIADIERDIHPPTIQQTAFVRSLCKLKIMGVSI
jgi:DNA-binding XRE family transcriptional regulator